MKTFLEWMCAACLFLVAFLCGALVMDVWRTTIARVDMVEERLVGLEKWKHDFETPIGG